MKKWYVGMLMFLGGVWVMITGTWVVITGILAAPYVMSSAGDGLLPLVYLLLTMAVSASLITPLAVPYFVNKRERGSHGHPEQPTAG